MRMKRFFVFLAAIIIFCTFYMVSSASLHDVHAVQAQTLNHVPLSSPHSFAPSPPPSNSHWAMRFFRIPGKPETRAPSSPPAFPVSETQAPSAEPSWSDTLLYGMFASPSAEERLHAVAGLALSQHPDRQRYLLAALFDADTRVATMALSLLTTSQDAPMPETFLDLLSSFSPEVVARSDDIVSRMGNVWMTPLATALADRSEPSHRRQWAAYCLGRSGVPAAIEAIGRAAWEGDEALAAACGQALAASGQGTALPYLQELVKHPLRANRWCAAQGLGRIGGDKALALLMEAAAAARLTDPEFCAQTLHVLGSMGDRRAVSLLVSMAAVPYPVGEAAMEALARITGLSYGHSPALWQQWLDAAQKGETHPSGAPSSE